MFRDDFKRKIQYKDTLNVSETSTRYRFARVSHNNLAVAVSSICSRVSYFLISVQESTSGLVLKELNQPGSNSAGVTFKACQEEIKPNNPLYNKCPKDSFQTFEASFMIFTNQTRNSSSDRRITCLMGYSNKELTM